MGGAASKAIRKLPKEKQPSVSSAKSVRPDAHPSLASSEATAERGAKDPHFMQKLSQLGPVRVDHPGPRHALRTASDAASMYRSRMRSEAEAAAATQSTRSMQNRLLATSLTALLDARKAVTGRAELEALATRYEVDVATLERISRYVNTPSTDERTIVRTRDEHGEESVRVMARWVDPTLSAGQVLK